MTQDQTTPPVVDPTVVIPPAPPIDTTTPAPPAPVDAMPIQPMPTAVEPTPAPPAPIMPPVPQFTPTDVTQPTPTETPNISDATLDQSSQSTATSSTTTTSPQPYASARDMIADYFVDESKPVIIPLRNNRVARAKALADMNSLMQLNERAKEFTKMIKEGMAPADWQQFLPLEDSVLRVCYFISELMLEPTYTQREALEAAKTCGGLVLSLGQGIMQQVMSAIGSGEVEALKRLGEGSSTT